MDSVRRYVTQFNGSGECGKVREEGVEHFWVNSKSTQVKTGNWTTIFQGKVESVKQIKLTETDPFAVVDKDTVTVRREGTNEHGEFWTEECSYNPTTNFKRINKSSI